MLASPEETAQAIRERLTGTQVWLEDKFDGIRAQVHRSADRVEIFTRDLKPISSQFPEVGAAMRLLSDEVIFDGEIIAHAEGKKLTFFDLQKRLGRRDQADFFLPSEVSVKYVVFDVLWKNGVSLLDQPLEVRRAELAALSIPAGLETITVIQAKNAEEIEAAFLAARRRGNEGLIAKDAASTYSPGRRGKSWLKLKKAFATLDVVVVKAEQGHGKRSHVLSDYTFAVRDEADGNTLKVIGKAYSGLTDAEIEELTEHFTQTTLSQKGRVRTVQPQIVLEIAFDSIQPSDRHNSGLAMRFPRIKAIRRDKAPADIDTLAYAMKLAGV
jgi:DNA ligase-1